MGAIVAGIDVGGTKIYGRAVRSNDLLDPLFEVRAPTPRGAPAVDEAVGEVVGQLASGAGGRLDAIGVGIAGLVDLTGVLRFGPNLPDVIDYAVAPSLAAAWGAPVAVDNDANTALLAEHRLGVAAGLSEVVLVTLGTGIGAGVMIGGQVQRGAAGFAGEPGHMVVDHSGPPCPCGRRGCWERFASGSGLGRLARDAAEAGQARRVVELAGGSPADVRGEQLTAAAVEGDREAQAVLRQFAWWVALGVANLANILDPEMVVIGGGLGGVGDLLLDPVREAFAGLVLAAQHRPSVRIEAARFGGDATAVGATLMAATGLGH